jgi:hypothetical protein
MAYTPFDHTKPDQSAQNITQAFTSIRGNDEALLDQLVTGGQLPGWNYDVTGGTNAQPTEITLTKSTDSNRKIRIYLTYDGSGNVLTFRAAKTTNGSTYDKMTYDGKDQCTLTYDGSGDLDSTSWGVST